MQVCISDVTAMKLCDKWYYACVILQTTAPVCVNTTGSAATASVINLLLRCTINDAHYVYYCIVVSLAPGSIQSDSE
jgi:hypothetical protein